MVLYMTFTSHTQSPTRQSDACMQVIHCSNAKLNTAIALLQSVYL